MSVQFRRRRRAAVVGTSLLALALAACSGGGSGDEQAKPLPTVTGNPAVTLDVFAPQAADWNLATNDFTKVVKDKFNLSIKWQTTTFDGGPAKEKRQISLASGDYPDLFPLQLVLRNILILNTTGGGAVDASVVLQRQQLADLLKYSLIVVASVPVLLIYPFVARYFTKGIMIGAVKG